MCGIVGFISLQGRTNAGEMLCEGLKCLEYRGYDSSGIAVLDDGKLIVRKGVGKIDAVAQKHGFREHHGTASAGHQRWATHGNVTDENAHPHQDCTGKIAVVHNGIIENYQQLRAELSAKGHSFKGQTDTEAIPHLIEQELKSEKSFQEAVRKALKKLHGSYALLILHADAPNQLIVARKESPLILGISDKALFAASDAVPFLDKTRKTVFLEDGEMAVLEATATNAGNETGSKHTQLMKGTYTVSEISSGKIVAKQVSEIKWSAESASKAGYAHFMLKEINEQPQAVKQALTQEAAQVQKFADQLSKAKTVVIIGMGTARHAGLLTRYAIGRLAGKHFEVVMASEYGYFAHEADKDTIVLAISQSGETADVLAPCRKAKEKGAAIFAIVNSVGSTLDRLSDERLYINAGPEIAVASTKAFTNQVVVGMLVGYAMAGKLQEGRKNLSQLPAKILECIEANNDNTKKIAEYLKGKEHAYYIGRGINFATALEASLKMKEISYLHAEGMPAGELKHGTLALIEKGTPVIAINPHDYTFAETLSNAIETKARGAHLIGVSNSDNEVYDELIKIPQADEMLYPILASVPLQLLAYYTAVARGNDVDKPRNLAKSCTVL